MGCGTWLILSAVAVVAFFYRAYLHLFAVPGWMPCDEIINWIVVKNLITTGQPVNFSYFPLGMHYLIYGLWLLIPTINLETLCKLFNPVVGALTVPVFFLLVRQFVDTGNALLTSVVFTFSEAYLYRSAGFGSSEPLGILLMIGAFYFFVKKSYVLCGVSMVLTYEVHLLPFFFGFATLAVSLLVTRFSRKALLVVVGAAIIVVGLFYTNLFPYQRQLTFISPLAMIERANIKNLGVFPLAELLTYGGAFVGSLATFFLGLGGFRRAPILAKMWIIVAILMTFILLLTYSALTLGPYRMIVYISLGAVFMYSFLKIPHKLIATGVILVLMFLSPTAFNGINLTLRANDTISAPEIAGIIWATQREVNLTSTDFFVVSDYPVIEYWNLYIAPKDVLVSTFDPELFESSVNARADYLEGNETIKLMYAEWGKAWGNKYMYVFLSERMKTQAFFERWIESRTYQYRKPISDRWATNPDWKLIYNEDGVKIYRMELYVSA